MSITVSLMSKQQGELKSFLDSYFNKDTGIDDDVIEWIYVYRNAADALDIINAAMDNDEKNHISVWMQIEDDDIIEITKRNRSKITNRVLNMINISVGNI